uniref:Uncharacterized protein n=1 Tax=Anguilla anguilla TaxID=7936 RepID=A0A0E9RHE3_ANGAN
MQYRQKCSTDKHMQYRQNAVQTEMQYTDKYVQYTETFSTDERVQYRQT